MKGILAAVLALAAADALALQTAPVSAPDSAAKREIAALYREYDRVVKSNDPRAFLQWFRANTVPGYTATSPRKRVTTREQILDHASKMARQGAGYWAGATMIGQRSRIDRLQLSGDTATVEVTEKTTTIHMDLEESAGITPEGDPMDPMPVRDTRLSRGREVWVRTGSGWKLRSTVGLSERADVYYLPQTPQRPQKRHTPRRRRRT